jgi:RNA polymerase sigma factor (TIGR02999 family)
MELKPLSSLIEEAEAAIPGAKERLFSALYTELHQLARRHLQGRNGMALSPTTLLHETYLSIAEGDSSFPDRARFMGYASRVMRGLIIDFVRQQKALKRGGEFEITRLDTQLSEGAKEQDGSAANLERLSEALDELMVCDARLAEVVDLKYFCGFSLTDIAAMRGVAFRTVQRDWDKARMFLVRELGSAG